MRKHWKQLCKLMCTVFPDSQVARPHAPTHPGPPCKAGVCSCSRQPAASPTLVTAGMPAREQGEEVAIPLIGPTCTACAWAATGCQLTDKGETKHFRGMPADPGTTLCLLEHRLQLSNRIQPPPCSRSAQGAFTPLFFCRQCSAVARQCLLLHFPSQHQALLWFWRATAEPSPGNHWQVFARLQQCGQLPAELVGSAEARGACRQHGQGPLLPQPVPSSTNRLLPGVSQSQASSRDPGWMGR